MDSTEQKQQFLRKEIIKKRYSPSEFTDYLLLKRPEGGDDISNWSMSSLENVVQEFQREAQQDITDSEDEDAESSIYRRDTDASQAFDGLPLRQAENSQPQTKNLRNDFHSYM